MQLFENLLKKIIEFQYNLLNFILLCWENILYPSNRFVKAERILIFRTGSLGDSICALPAINTIIKNFPDAKVDLLTNAGAENLVSLNQLIAPEIINEPINYYGKSKKELIKYLKTKQYDLLIELPQTLATLRTLLRNVLFAKLIGAKYAFGWKVSSNRFLAYYQAKLIKFDNERDRLLKICVNHGLKNYGLVYPLGINDDIKEVIRKLVETSGLSKEEENIAVVMGSKRPQNRWPLEYFDEVIGYLSQAGKRIILIGSNEDVQLAEKLKNKTNVYNFCGKLKPLETAELLKYCKFTLSNDTGPMHLSYAVGTEVIAIFSSRDYPNKWYPPLNKNIVFRTNKFLCKTCHKKTKNNCNCLKEIKPNVISTLLSK